MAFQDLTQEQQDAVQALSAIVRPLIGEFARLLEKFRAVVSGYVGNVETTLSALQNGDAIPNATDLAGAQSMTKAEFVTLVGYMIVACATPDGSSGSFNTNYHRSLYAKAAGPANLIQG